MAMTISREGPSSSAPRSFARRRTNRRDAQGLHPRLRAARQDSPTPNFRRWHTKIGPVKAQVQRQGHLSDLDPPNGYKISGQGDGGVAGFAKGGATVKLTPKDGGTPRPTRSRPRSAANSRSSASA